MRRARPPRPQSLSSTSRSANGPPRARSKAVLINASLASLILAAVLYTHLRLHWLSSRADGNSCGTYDSRHNTGLDASLLADINQLRYQQQLLQAERDQQLGIQWTREPFDSAAANRTDGRDGKPPLFMFVAVFTSRDSKDRRSEVRRAWMRNAPMQANIVVRFVLTESERSAQSDAEAAAFGDILITDGSLHGYRSIVYKTYFVLKHAVQHYDVRFIVKADEDAFVNVVALAEELRGACQSVGCRKERIYFGREIRNNVVRLDPGDKWQDVEYLNHTSLKTYMPYMMGGGYAVSADLARVILGINQQATNSSMLKFMPNEDVSLGFWLMSVDLRRIDHPKVVTWGHPCCFDRVRRKGGRPDDNRAWFRPTVDLCREGWLILHKIEYPQEMEYLGERMRQCAQVRRLTDRTRQLAVATHVATKPPVGPQNGKIEQLPGGANGWEFHLASAPWAPSGNSLLAISSPTDAARVAAAAGVSDYAQVGIFRHASGNTWQWQKLDKSQAGSLSMGPRQQWLDASSRHLAFNDLSCAALQAKAEGMGACAVVYDTEARVRVRVLPRPLYASAPDGLSALTFDFRRLDMLRPGEGYPARAAEEKLLGHPGLDTCGLWLMDMLTGQQQLLVSFRRMFEAARLGQGSGKLGATDTLLPLMHQAAEGCLHAVSHVQYNREGDSAVFEYLVGQCGSSPPENSSSSSRSRSKYSRSGIDSSQTFLFTVSVAGGQLAGDSQQLWGVPLPAGRALDYGDRGLLLIGAPAVDSASASASSPIVYEVDVRTANITRLELPGNHKGPAMCRYYHDNTRFVTCGTASPPTAPKVFVWDRWNNQVHVVGEPLVQKSSVNGLSRPVLPVPAWSPSGRHLAFDLDGGAQGRVVHVADISQLDAAMTPTLEQRHGLSPTGGRQVMVVLGAGRGAAIRRWRRATSGAPGWVVHAWEADPACFTALRSLARSFGSSSSSKGGSMTVHPVAAWTHPTTVVLNTGEVSAVGYDYRDGRRPKRLNKRLAAWLRQQRFGYAATTRGTMFSPARSPATNMTVPALDLSSWLAHTVTPQDHVHLHMDVGGAEFEVLERMVEDGSLLLVDKIDVKWNDVFRPHLAEWPSFYTQVFAMLGIDDLSSSTSDPSKLQ